MGMLAQKVSARRSKLGSLETVRALAALLVVGFHTQGVAYKVLGTEPFHGLLSGGKRGVDLFFVLSGFVIYYVHAKDLGRPSRLRRYVFNRAARIYPILWIVTALSVPLFLLGFGAAAESGALRLWNVLASFLLLPQQVPALVSVTWTLKYEAFFYAIFAVGIVNFRLGAALFLGWQGLTAIALCAGDITASYYGSFYIRPICLEFGIGVAGAVLVARLRDRGIMPPAPLLAAALAAGIAIFAVAGYTDPMLIKAEEPRCLIFGAAAGLIITSLVLLEVAGRYRAPGLALALGGASYAIYLVHWSVMRLELAMLARLHLSPQSDPAFLAIGAAAIGVGLAFCTAVDRPIQRHLHAWYGRRQAPGPAAAQVGAGA